jgi:hypothetical protein
VANAQGVLKESIWRDKDFRALTRSAQATYLQLISQKDLDRAGIQPLMVTRLARGCDEVTEADIWQDLKLLAERRFAFYDEETDELFVRSYMRACEIVKYPNILKNALRCATLVASEPLRHELAQELRRLRRAEANRVADDIDPGEPFENRSKTNWNPSETLPEPLNGSETPTEPRGMGKGKGSSLVPEIEGFRAEQPNTVTTKPDESEPPAPNCPRHPHGTTDNCGACGEARRSRQKWDTEQRRAQGAARSDEARRSAELRAAAVTECDLCDNDGYRGAILCDHDPDGEARTSRGIAAVKAALAGKDA